MNIKLYEEFSDLGNPAPDLRIPLLIFPSQDHFWRSFEVNFPS